jgi:hypothetical protein
MERLNKKEPCLILMNHSCFLDLQIAESVMFPRPLNIVCTSDGFVGKNLLMRLIGCIPTNKFVTDFGLIRKMQYAITKLKSSILMFPEASYSFDGTATPLPSSLFKCIKLLNVPVIMIRTYGAFSRNPLYNNLQIRKGVKVSADVKYLLSKEDIQSKSLEEITSIVRNEFAFDNFKWQQENNIKISDNFRADSLNRVLFKCPSCKTEFKMASKGAEIFCTECNKRWTLLEDGNLQANSGETEFSHVPDWFEWERSEVRREVEEGSYSFTDEVDVYSLPHCYKFRPLGKATLTHTINEGFVLSGHHRGKDYKIVRQPIEMNSLHVEYDFPHVKPFDCIDISTEHDSFYCYPTKENVVTKLAFATEILFEKNNESKKRVKRERQTSES